jgi:uncharacterized protein (TIGR02391 family)
MIDKLTHLERIARLSGAYSIPSADLESEALHPFDKLNIHPLIVDVCKKLFDDGHYSQSTFEAFKLIDRTVASLSNVKKSGFKLMLEVFHEKEQKIRLTNLSNESEIDEQKGYAFLFAGSLMGIRNPRGHLVGNLDTIDLCLDHLALASSLMRRLDGRVK